MVSVGDEVNPRGGELPVRAGCGSLVRWLFGAWGTWARMAILVVALFVLAVLAAWLLGVTITVGPVSIERV